jgi:hypothetical protein
MESSFNISPAKLPTTLKSSSDWIKWLFYVESAAKQDEIWQYIDPATPAKVLVEPTKPKRLTLEELRARDEAQKELDKYEQEDYRDAKREYDQRKKALSSLFTKMQGSIDSKYYSILIGATTPRQILEKVKPYFAPSTLGREHQVRRDYKSVLEQKISSTDLDEWISRWTEVYTEAKALNLPEVATEDRAIDDFLTAVEPLASAFTNLVQATLIQNDNKYSLLQIVEQFREAARRVKTAPQRANHSAFVGQKEGQKERPKPRDPCFCGKEHFWDKCPYLNYNKRPNNFDSDTNLLEEIRAKLKDDSDLAIRVKSSIIKRKGTLNPDVFDDGKGKTLGSFTTAVYSASQDYKLKNHWILDSGSNIHVTNSLEDYSETAKATADDKIIAGATVYDIVSYGTTEVPVATASGGGYITLLNVAYIPNFMTNLVSLGKMVQKGVHWDTEKNNLRYKGKHLCHVHQLGGHWTLTPTPIQRKTDLPLNHTAMVTAQAKSTAPKVRTSTAREWHNLLGHPSHEALGHMVNATRGVLMTDSPKFGVCDPCKLSKATELVSRRPGHEDPTRGPFDRVSWDLIYMDESFDGERYISHFKCCYTGMNHVYTQARKTTTLATFKYHLISLITQYNKRVRVIRIDGESSLAAEFATFIAGMGIKVERSAPDVHAQNGHAERGGRSIVTMARTMRIHANLPSNLWSELVKTAGYLLNRTPNRRNGWKTPLEAATGIIPSLAHLHPIGCKSYALIHNIPKLQKMEPRAQIGYLVGYNSTNLWRIWDPRKGQIKVLRDVTFDNSTLYNPDQLPLPALLTSLPEEPVRSIYEDMYVTEEDSPTGDSYADKPPLAEASSQPPTQTAPAPSEKVPEASGEPNETEPALPTPEATPIPDAIQEDATEEASPERDIDISPPDEIETPQDTIVVHVPQETPHPQPDQIQSASGRRRSINNSDFTEEFIMPEGIKRTRKPRKQAYSAAIQRAKDSVDGFSDSYYGAFGAYKEAIPPTRFHRDQLPPEPRNWREMQRHQFSKEFADAADLEWTTLLAKGTFEEVSTGDKAKEALPLTWVFKYKFDEGGYLSKFKARVCVRGDLQMTEKETYSATLAAASFRLLMIIVAAFDLEMIQLDAINAFLNSKIDDEEIYIRFPNGYEKANRLLRLLRGLYGLKRSPLLWFEELTGTLKSLGFMEINSMHCVMANHVAIILFYVDDIIFLFQESMRTQVMHIIEKLQEKYPLHSLPKANWFLGVRILRNRPAKQLWLCQDSYIDKISAKFHQMDNGRATKTPLPMEKLQANQDDASAANTHLYQQVIGSINFATTMTRIDTAFATTSLSRYLSNPSSIHLSLANRAVRYLEATKYYAQQYTGLPTIDLVAYSDASYADYPDRKSSQGFIICLGGNPFVWKASKQTTVTTSTTEAELLALTDAGKEAMLWKRALNNLRQYLPTNPDDPEINSSVKVFCDNTQTIRLLTNPTAEMQTKLRHVDIHNHWARQETENGSMKVSWISTKDMVADLLTKALPSDKHARFMRQLGLVPIDIHDIE